MRYNEPNKTAKAQKKGSKKMKKSIKAELVANGFEHVLYGTIFLKDGVHVYLSEYDNKTFSITCQKLADAQDENSNVVSRSHLYRHYTVFQGHAVIAADIAKIALSEVAKH
mgnify:FL=1